MIFDAKIQIIQEKKGKKEEKERKKGRKKKKIALSEIICYFDDFF